MASANDESPQLLVSIALTGAVVLVIEVAGMRLLAPYFGNTIFTTTSVLSTVLLALSIGYYVGGIWADRYPSPQRFYWYIVFAALAVAASNVLGVLILPALSSSLPVTIGPLVAALLLFGVPAVILGALSPFAIRLLQTGDARTAGRVAGRVFFFSTLGSISGSLISGYWLVPQYSLPMIFAGASTMLFVIGLLGVWRREGSARWRIVALFLVLLVLLVVQVSANQFAGPNVRFVKNGYYELLRVLELEWNGRPALALMQDRSVSSVAYTESAALASDYTQYAALAAVPLKGRSDPRALVVGAGAYLVPKYLIETFPELVVDVVDIEPELRLIGQQYFGVPDDERIRDVVADGRQFLRRTNERYAFIFLDAFQTLYSIPSHLTTSEFFALVRNRLDTDGIIMMNVIGSRDTSQSTVVLSVVNTLRTVFSEVRVFAVRGPDPGVVQNYILVAGNAPLADSTASTEVVGVRELLAHEVKLTPNDLANQRVLTDAFAPVEWMSVRAIVR